MSNFRFPLRLATGLTGALSLVDVRLAMAAGESSEVNTLFFPLLFFAGLLLVTFGFFIRSRRHIRTLHTMTGSMIDALSALVIGLNGQKQIVELNQAAADHLGKTKEEIIGHAFVDLYGDLPISGSQIEQAQQSKSTLALDKVPDSRQEHFWNIRISPWNRGLDQGAILHLEERTEQARFETLMVQKDKLFTVSRLAIGLMHEINNPLASILQNMQVIHNRFGGQLQKNRAAADHCGTSMEKISRYLAERGIDRAIESVRESARRAAQVIDALVNFSRQDDENEAFHSLSGLLDRALDLASGDFDLKEQYDFLQIRVERDYDPELPPVRCRALKLQQAFFALLHFRAERMLQHRCADTPRLVLKLCREGDQARIQLDDNGPQLAPEERRRIFRPSLAEPDQGLGLCVCQFIICGLHGGTISFESGDAGENRIVVRLPLERSTYE